MASRADLKTVISADMTQFSATMRKAGALAKNTGSAIAGGIGKAASGIARASASAAKLGVGLTAAASAAALFKGVKLAADMQSTSVAFETMLGSAESAKKVLGQLQKLGAETPFEFPDLANAGRMLIAFGESADTVTETLRRVGDVSSGVQAPIGEIAELYGKARVQGTLFAEDINQLTGRGIPIIQQFAQQLGVSQGEVKKLASEGKITFPMLEKAFISLTSEGGQFFGMMEKQSKTFNGVWSTLTDTINMGLAAVGQPIMEELIPHMNLLIEKIGQVDFGTMGRDLADKIPMMLDGAVKIIDAAYQAYQWFKKGVDLLGSSFGTLFSTDFWESAGKLIAGNLLKAVGMFEQALYTVINEGDLSKAIEGFTSGDAGPLGDLGKSFANGAVSQMAPYMEQFGEILNRPIETLGDTLAKYKNVEIFGPPKPADNQSPSPSPSAPGTFKRQDDGTKFGPSKDLMTPQIFGPSKDLMSEEAKIAKWLDKKQAGQLGAGFKGLAERTGMQASMFRGNAPGSDNVFSKDRERLGLGSGLGGGMGRWSGRQGIGDASVTGGLGEKRRLRTSADDKGAKKNLSIQEKQVEFLESIEGKIADSLKVN